MCILARCEKTTILIARNGFAEMLAKLSFERVIETIVILTTNQLGALWKINKQG